MDRDTSLEGTRGAAPLVSVVVPVYNAGEFLSPCLESVFAQTLADFELVCVDDGSTDGSADALDGYAAHDARMRVLHQQNAGVSAARNAGMDLARGRYLLFLDADDWLEPKALEHLVRSMERDGSDICVCANRNFDMRFEGGNSRKNCLNMRQVPSELPFEPARNERYLFNFCSFNVWNKLFRTAFLSAAGIRFRPLRFSEDALFCAEALLAARLVSVVDEPLHWYRVGNAQSAIAGIPSDILAGYRALADIKGLLVEAGRYEGELKQSFVNKALGHLLFYCRKATTLDSLREWYAFMVERGFEDLDIVGHDASYFYSAADHDQLMVVLGAGGAEEFAFERFQRALAARDRANARARAAEARARRAEAELHRAEARIENIEGSKSYRIAQFIRRIALRLGIRTA